jgi:hypothetical protein
MHLAGKRTARDIEFQVWVVGDGATADFDLFADDGTQVPGTALPSGVWSFVAKKADLVKNRNAWPDIGHPTLRIKEPTWLSGSPTVHLTATQAGALLPNSDATGGDPSLVTTLSTKGKTVSAAFRLDLR